MPPLAGSTTCWSHSAAHATERAKAQQQGGQARNLQLGRAAHVPREEPPSWWTLGNTADARSALGFVTQELLAGRMAARDANAAVGALMAIVAVQRDIEIERRLSLLEGAIQRRKS